MAALLPLYPAPIRPRDRTGEIEAPMQHFDIYGPRIPIGMEVYSLAERFQEGFDINPFGGGHGWWPVVEIATPSPRDQKEVV